LTPKTKVKVNNNAWFVKSLLEKNTLVVTTWRVKQNIEKLKGKQITNKTSCATSITRMEQASIPIEYGMQRTSHWNTKSYNKYN
jgi:hypothetical protein